ncbi:MAG TPA: hypothetical protein VF018_09595 [Acidobacteriaceae bacterium]
MNARAADRRVLLLISAAAAIAVLPLAVHGPSYGHDFNFHLLNWIEAARQFSHGTLYPRWAYSPAYNAGEPRFVFYPPISWTVGALIGLLLTHIPGLPPEVAWTATAIIFTWICLTAAGLSMYWAARAVANGKAAVLAAVLYAVNPYMLFTAYERTAYAELLAAAWMPLLLKAVLAPEVRVVRVAVPIALLWLTNAPAAVIGCYTAAVLVVSRMGTEALGRPPRIAATLRTIAKPSAIGTLLGFGLAAFYLVPAAWERRFVQVSMATIVNMRIDHNFLFERTGSSVDAVAHDAVLRTASWVAVSLLLAAYLSLLACWNQQRTHQSPFEHRPLHLVPLLSFLSIVTFLLTGWSNPVWQHTPEMLFLQFPWRLLTVVAPLTALALASAISEVRISNRIVSVLGLASAGILTVSMYKAFHQLAESNQTVADHVHAFVRKEGAEPTDEYTPQTADNDALTIGKPPYWLAPESSAPAPARSVPGPAPEHFTVQGKRPEFLILNLRDYPAWRVLLNRQTVAERAQRDDGLIAFAVLAGTSTIDLRYVRGWDDIAGDGISLIAVLALVAASLRKRLPNAVG